jgi:hypothetical protein
MIAIFGHFEPLSARNRDIFLGKNAMLICGLSIAVFGVVRNKNILISFRQKS